MIQAIDLKMGQLSSTGDIELRDKYLRDKEDLENMYSNSNRLENVQSGFWKCPRCEMLNVERHIFCESCGKNRRGRVRTE